MYKICKSFNIYEPADLKNGIVIGTVFGHRDFSMPLPALASHMAIFGKTSTGKSTLLLNIAEQLINANETVILIDPHGELSYKVLKTVPDTRNDDLVYISPEFTRVGAEYYSVTMNALHVNLSSDTVKNEMERLRAIDNIKTLFSKDDKFSSGTWGPRLELIFSVVARAILELDSNATILDLLDILIDKSARARFLRLTKDEDVINFLRALGRSRADLEYVTSSINKLLPIKKNIFIRELIASKTPSLDFESLLKSRPLIIVNLSKSNISENLSGMVGSLIISMIWSAALKISSKKQIFLIIDELQNFNALNLKSMLSEGRKYGISMILATQHLNQIHAELLDSIIGNVSNIGSFNIGSTDSKYLKSLFSPYPELEHKIEHLLENMDRNMLLFKTVIEGKHRIFTVATFNHVDNSVDPGKLIEYSVLKYGKKIALENNNADFVLFSIYSLISRKQHKLTFDDIYRELNALKKIEVSELDLILRNYQARDLIGNNDGFYITVDGEKYIGSISEVERVLNEGEYHRYLINRAVQYLNSMNINCEVLDQISKEQPDAIIKVNKKIINIEAEFGELSKKVTILNHLIKYRTRNVIFLTFNNDAEKLYSFLKAPYRMQNNQKIAYILDGQPLDWTLAGNILKRSKIWIIPDPGETKAIREYKMY